MLHIASPAFEPFFSSSDSSSHHSAFISSHLGEGRVQPPLDPPPDPALTRYPNPRMLQQPAAVPLSPKRPGDKWVWKDKREELGSLVQVSRVKSRIHPSLSSADNVPICLRRISSSRSTLPRQTCIRFRWWMRRSHLILVRPSDSASHYPRLLVCLLTLSRLAHPELVLDFNPYSSRGPKLVSQMVDDFWTGNGEGASGQVLIIGRGRDP